MSYSVILADPPWKYGFSRSKSRKVENHYPTLTPQQIAELPVKGLANEDCVLFLWATAPKLPEALYVMQQWGFEYKTCAVWDKKLVGMGYYFRGRHELLLVGTKGSPGVPLPPHRPASIIESKRTKHSRKPPEVHTIIERMYPNARRIELFARERREGWDVWGNEVESDVNLEGPNTHTASACSTV